MALQAEREEKKENENVCEAIRFSITGRAAHLRIKKLLPDSWMDCSPYNTSRDSNPLESDEHLHFIWENAPRNETKSLRDSAACYSHLPNGIGILDDKWVLGRLFNYEQKNSKETVDHFHPLITHFIRGKSGLVALREKLQKKQLQNDKRYMLQDLDPDFNVPSKQISTTKPQNTWVIKDANSNGFGGIWITNMQQDDILLHEEKSPLHEDHRYVAQEYTWPPILYQRKKCHIRVYACMMNGMAFVHKRCFLHVANEEFQTSCSNDNTHQDFDPSVHITNCCANSHDAEKFAGEILADLSLDEAFQNEFVDGQKVIPLKKYYPSIAASVHVLAKNAMTFVQGGDANCGFEYLGLDFILSSNAKGAPVAYLLEVNCPPSQDTATGLPFAENLHDDVLRDLLKMWIIPAVEGRICRNKCPRDTMGWNLVFQQDFSNNGTSAPGLMLPSKASLLNKIRWRLFEKKMHKLDIQQEQEESRRKSEESDNFTNNFTNFARSQFPYFQDKGNERKSPVFLENAGGAQVPSQVVHQMVESLSHRHRSFIGQKSKEEARKVTLTLLGASEDNYNAYFGANATSMFERLARYFAKLGYIKDHDEIVIASENHVANVNPWMDLAEDVGAEVKWISSSQMSNMVQKLDTVLSEKTRLICLSHASNILGSIRDIGAICKNIKSNYPHAQIVIDGVAASPHVYADLDNVKADWYCVSFHKIFGPHVGALLARKVAIEQVHIHVDRTLDASKILECGTVNYEGCTGIIGLGNYVISLAMNNKRNSNAFMPMNEGQSSKVINAGQDPVERRKLQGSSSSLTKYLVMKAYDDIQYTEKQFLEYVKKELKSNPHVRLICDEAHNISIISFTHTKIASAEIVRHCALHGIIVRCGYFLCTTQLQNERSIPRDGGIVRASFCHYNTLEEAKLLIVTLKTIDGWNDVPFLEN